MGWTLRRGSTPFWTRKSPLSSPQSPPVPTVSHQALRHRHRAHALDLAMEEDGEAPGLSSNIRFPVKPHSNHTWSCGWPASSCSVTPSLSILKSPFFFAFLFLGWSYSHLTLECLILCFSHMGMPCFSIYSRSSLRKETFHTLLLALFLTKLGWAHSRFSTRVMRHEDESLEGKMGRMKGTEAWPPTAPCWSNPCQDLGRTQRMMYRHYSLKDSDDSTTRKQLEKWMPDYMA